MNIGNTLKTVAKVAGTGAPGIVYNGVKYGNWTDPTPGYGAVNVARTQMSNSMGGAKSATPVKDAPVAPNSQSVYAGDAGRGTAGASAQDIAKYEQSIGMVNSALGRLPSALDIARANIETMYGQNFNELNSDKAKTQNEYQSGKTQSAQSYLTNKNNINDQASGGLRGLLRILGQAGAGGSTDTFNAGQAVAQDASAKRAGAGETFSQNEQALDTNWGNYQNDWDNSKRKLDDWKSQQLNQATASSESTRQNLLQKLAELTGARAQARGGSYTAASQPLLDQANAIAGQVDQLGRISPTYTGSTPIYNAPSLDSYTVNETAGPEVAQNAGEQIATPFLSLLLGQKDKNQQQPIY